VFACRSTIEVSAFRSPYQVAPGPWPRPPAFEGELFIGNGTANMIHLGFDVEGSPAPVQEILDILDRRGVKTTMYVLGNWAETYPVLVQEIANRGHEMANHAFSHQNLKDLPAETILAELERTEDVIFALTGQTTRPWFRPPFGSRSEVVVEMAFSGGWTTVVWSVSAEDWREEADADLMCQTMRDGSFPGSILYAHTNHPDMPETIDRYIGEMQSRGYTFVPMSVMMAPDPVAWLVAP
jgi:peptidoglycan/xylan/chitin deacetylase (PgdA/CDA1 family)